MEDDLVYSTDPSFQRPAGAGRRGNPKRMDRARKKSNVHAPEESFKLETISVFMRIEKSGRSGKTVTVIDRFPRSESFLNQLCRDLKNRCGSGGKHGYGDAGGYIEIQGDKRDVLRKILLDKGIQCKG